MEWGDRTGWVGVGGSVWRELLREYEGYRCSRTFACTCRYFSFREYGNEAHWIGPQHGRLYVFR